MLTLLLILFVDIVLGVYTFAITDGWWESYSDLLMGGVDPYEMGLAFPPLYLYIINFLRINITDSYLYLKIILSCVNLINFTVAYFVCKRFVGNGPGLIAISTVFALSILNGNYLVKDYHTLLQLLIGLCLLIYTYPGRGNTSCRPVILLGILAVAVGLVKQNVGIFFGIGLMPYYFKQFALQLKRTVIYILAIFISIVTFILFADGNWLSIFSGNDAKGSVLKILFRFIFDRETRNFELAALLIIVTTFAITKGWQLYSFKITSLRSKFKFISLEVIIVASWLLIAIFLNRRIGFVNMLLVYSLAWPILRILYFKSMGEVVNTPQIALPLFALAYCNTTTAGYNIVGLFYLVLIFVAEISGIAVKNINILTSWNVGRKAAGAFAISIVLYGFLLKIASPYGYSWWGVNSGGLLSSTNKLVNHGVLNGQFVDSQTLKAIEVLESGKDSNGCILAYPSIPIAYQLSNSKYCYQPVLWFDVATTKKINSTINDIKNNQPERIFWLRPPQEVYNEHEILRGKQSPLQEIDKWVIDQCLRGNYKLVSAIPTFLQGYTASSTGEVAVGFYNSTHELGDYMDSAYGPNRKVIFDRYSTYVDYIEENPSIHISPVPVLYSFKKVK